MICLLQQLCEEWNTKTDIEKQFKPFHTAVNNLVSAGATHNHEHTPISRRTSVVLTKVILARANGGLLSVNPSITNT